MTKIWPLKVGLLNPKSIWRGVAPEIDEVKFDGHMTITTILFFPRMMVRQPSNLAQGTTDVSDSFACG